MSGGISPDFVFDKVGEESDGLIDGPKQTVKELDPTLSMLDDDGDFEDASLGGEAKSDQESDDPFEGFGTSHMMIAKFILGMIDQSRAIWLSNIAYKNIDHVDKYKYYKDLEDPEHAPMVNAMAYVVRKYSLSKTPEIVLLVGLLLSTFALYQMAQSDREKEEERQAKEQQVNNKPPAKEPNNNSNQTVPGL